MEDHLALGALHVEHTFVTQHARAIHLDDGTQEVLELGGIKGPCGAVNKTLHVVIVVVVVPVFVLV